MTVNRKEPKGNSKEKELGNDREEYGSNKQTSPSMTVEKETERDNEKQYDDKTTL